MKKFVLALVFCVVIAYGCKPVDRSDSETQSLGKVGKVVDIFSKGKKLTKAARVSGAVEDAIRHNDIENLKILLKNADFSDEVSLLYYRSLRSKQDEFTNAVDISTLRIYRISGKPHQKAMGFDGEIQRITKDVFDFSDLLNRRSLQFKDIIESTADDKKISIASKLCCRQPKSKLEPQSLFSDLLESEHKRLREAEAYLKEIDELASSNLEAMKKLDSTLTPEYKKYRQNIVSFRVAKDKLENTLKKYESTARNVVMTD